VLQHGAGLFQRGLADLAAGEHARQFPHAFFLAGKVRRSGLGATSAAKLLNSVAARRRIRTALLTVETVACLARHVPPPSAPYT
jgi:hypothetical protein